MQFINRVSGQGNIMRASGARLVPNSPAARGRRAATAALPAGPKIAGEWGTVRKDGTGIFINHKGTWVIPADSIQRCPDGRYRLLVEVFNDLIQDLQEAVEQTIAAQRGWYSCIETSRVSMQNDPYFPDWAWGSVVDYDHRGDFTVIDQAWTAWSRLEVLEARARRVLEKIVQIHSVQIHSPCPTCWGMSSENVGTVCPTCDSAHELER